MTAAWLADARAVPLAVAARALGVRVTERGGRPVALSPCPACHAERRHPRRRDRRGAVGVTRDACGWRCFECGEGGDALGLVRWCLGRAPLDDVRAWYASRGWCAPKDTESGGMRAPARVGIVRPPVAEVESEHPRPPKGDVAALWAACLAVNADPDVAAWLASRGLDPDCVADLDLARALPPAATLPSWAAYRGRPWSAGWRCIFPAYGATGALESLGARLIREEREEEDKTSAASAGPGSASGLVMADGLARQVLSAGRAPEWWGDAPLRVFVVEGEPDYLTAATLWSDADDDAPAVIGIYSGAWSPEIASRIPDRAVVAVWAHADRDGARYAREIAATLASRCSVRHLRAREAA